MNSELSMDQILIEKLTNILEVNLDKENFGVKEFANEAGLSRSKLHRKLKSLTGKSASRFIREFRLQKAMVMLQNNVATASEIAYRVGFSSPTYFNTCFHDYYGYPPGEVKFRNSNGVNINNEEHDLEDSSTAQSISKTPSLKKRLLAKRMVWINTVFILLLSVVSYNLYQNYKAHFSEELILKGDDDKSIAILPFKNLSEAKEDEFFTRGVRTALQNQLNTLNGLKVISENSMEKYIGSKMDPSEIANEIGVTYLMDGSVQKYGDSIRVIIYFINARENQQLNSMVYIEEFKNLLTLQGKIAEEVAEELNIKLSHEEVEQFDKKPTDNLQAYNLYIKGRFFWHRRTEEDLYRSIHYFNQAIKLDSTFALAYAGLADTFYVMPWYIQVKDRDSVFNIAKEYADKTLYFNKNNAEAHATLGAILCYKDWKWEASEKEFKIAIQINPNYATAHQYYAELLEIIGRFKEAREQCNRALKLNPNSRIMLLNSAGLYVGEGLFEKAISEAYKAKELNKFDVRPYDIIIQSYAYMGKDKMAMKEFEERVKVDSNPHMETVKGLRDAFKVSGMKGFYTFLIDSFLKSGEAIKNPIAMANFYAFVGEQANALEWLEFAYIHSDHGLIGLKKDFCYRHLQNEPRFIALLEKMGLAD